MSSTQLPLLKYALLLLFISLVNWFGASCAVPPPVSATQDSVTTNIKLYTHAWDEIMNKGKLNMFNDSNFTSDVVMHVRPKDAVGIDSARAYYANFLTGFSNIKFTIKDVFGQGNKLVKYWNFKGTHTGVFFGIPATGKTVSLDGTTLCAWRTAKSQRRGIFLIIWIL